MGFFDSFKATLSGENESGNTFVILDNAYMCPTCGHTRFDDYTVELGPVGPVKVLKCCRCNHIEMFAEE